MKIAVESLHADAIRATISEKDGNRFATRLPGEDRNKSMAISGCRLSVRSSCQLPGLADASVRE